MYPPRPFMHHAQPFFLPVELLYAALIIAMCVIIYVMTKELYTLSKYKGIQYFRETFFFFALAYLFRLVPLLFRLSDLHLPGFRIGFVMGTFLFSYASTMAILSIVRSATWKRLRTPLLRSEVIYHLFAMLVALLVFFSTDILVFFFSQVFLIVVAFLLTFLLHQRRAKRPSKTFLLYVLLLLFWLLNIAIVVIPKFLSVTVYVFYAASILVFGIIFFRVLGRVKGRY